MGKRSFLLLTGLCYWWNKGAVEGFSVLPLQSESIRTAQRQSTWLYSSDYRGDSSDGRSSSRFEGNRRQPTQDEIAVMDEMILKMADSKPYELVNAVRRAFRVIRTPAFFMRIADLTDTEKDPTKKEKLQALASNLVSTLEVVVETTEEQLDERAEQVEKVVKAAAEPDSGEFLVPLLPERVEAMRTILQDMEEGDLDEGFLLTLDAWMNKSHKDGMDLMVGILQKVLQMYAGMQVERGLKRQNNEEQAERSEEAISFLKDLFQTDADSWDSLIAKRTANAEDKNSTLESLRKEIQRTMESIVLSLEAGSMAQRVQAEYLQEMLKRVDNAQAAAR